MAAPCGTRCKRLFGEMNAGVFETVQINKYNCTPFPLTNKINAGIGQGIEDADLESSVQLYSIPASQAFAIVIQEAQEAKVELLNSNGRSLKATFIKGGKATMGIGEFASGLYLVKIKTARGIVVKKLTITNHQLTINSDQ